MSELFEAGVIVTAIGMSVVFALLTLLVGIIRGMSYLSASLSNQVSEPLALSSTQVTIAPNDRDIVGVISAAITVYRKRRQQL